MYLLKLLNNGSNGYSIMSDEEPNKSKNDPDNKNQNDPYLTAILNVDALEECGKIDYEQIFAERDRRLNNGKR